MQVQHEQVRRSGRNTGILRQKTGGRSIREGHVHAGYDYSLWAGDQRVTTLAEEHSRGLAKEWGPAWAIVPCFSFRAAISQ